MKQERLKPTGPLNRCHHDNRLWLSIIVLIWVDITLICTLLGLLRFCECCRGVWTTNAKLNTRITVIALFFFWDLDLSLFLLIPLDNNTQPLLLCKFFLNLALCLTKTSGSLKKKMLYNLKPPCHTLLHYQESRHLASLVFWVAEA